MRELLHDPFYELLERYPRCGVEYCLIEADSPHQGYPSHKDAVQFAALKAIERDIDEQLQDYANRYPKQFEDVDISDDQPAE